MHTLLSVHVLLSFVVKTQPVAGLQASSVQALLSLQTIAGFSHKPVAGLQLLAVQALPSLQAGGGPPVQTPAAHESFVVHALPSSHAPVMFVCVQLPFTQASAVHARPSLQSESAAHTETRLTHQPERLPAPGANSSSTQRFHVPLGLVPTKTDSALPPVGTGAGAGKTSPAP